MYAHYSFAKKYAESQGIKSMRQWFAKHNIHKGGQPLPSNIPSDPAKHYGVSWAEFLDTSVPVSVSLDLLDS